MAYCKNCGAQLVYGAKFCQKCGYSTKDRSSAYTQRQQEFAGKLYKCPNCGEVLKSFEVNCPACGYELRGAKASSAVKEFALKLEAIESRREYEKPSGWFRSADASQQISKTDEQKISLIKSFSVPNTKEDMLEFMILATSSMNMGTYDPSKKSSMSKSEKELTAAWFAKVQQVYEKAKRSYSTDNIFMEIKVLYDKCNEDIKKAKKKGVLKLLLLHGWMPILFIAILVSGEIYAPISEQNENARLEAIVVEIEEQLERGEYKYALMNADALVYSGTMRNEEQERQWAIKREYWIDKVIEEAAEDGIILDPPVDNEDSGETTDGSVDDTDNSVNGFVEGFEDGLQSGVESTEENIDEFNRILNGEETVTQQEEN